MDTTEGNKLIAEFMGNMREDGMWFFDEPMPFTMADESRLSFNSSWDWLMPVVEKIENFNDGCTLFIIEDERCHVDSQNGFEVDSVGYTKIQATYNAVVEFIKWYNDNK